MAGFPQLGAGAQLLSLVLGPLPQAGEARHVGSATSGLAAGSRDLFSSGRACDPRAGVGASGCCKLHSAPCRAGTRCEEAHPLLPMRWRPVSWLFCQGVWP